jgi:hypothetical protein
MGITITSILDNLVFGIFGEPIYFSVIIASIFLYYAIKYDIPKWGFIAFFLPLSIWISFYYLPSSVVIILLVSIGILLAPRMLRFFNG